MNKSLFFIVSALLVGCSSSMMLRQPAIMSCENQGLKGCDKFADGAIQYADGNKDKGLKLIQEGAIQNSPDKVEPFLKILSELVGSDFTKDSIAAAPVVNVKLPESGLNAEVKPAPDLKVIKRGNTSLRNSPFPCNRGGVKTNCVGVFIEEIVITSVVFSEGCTEAAVASINLNVLGPDEMIELLNSNWFVTKNITSNLHIETGHMFLATSSNPNCFVFWEGYQNER